MILVDTSIWVDHIRRADRMLTDLLEQNEVLSHPFIVGEVALGGVRPEVIVALRKLPRAAIASDDEVLVLIEEKRFASRGIGYVDSHLLASAGLTGGAKVWSHDKRLMSLAQELDLAASLASPFA